MPTTTRNTWGDISAKKKKKDHGLAFIKCPVRLEETNSNLKMCFNCCCKLTLFFPYRQLTFEKSPFRMCETERIRRDTDGDGGSPPPPPQRDAHSCSVYIRMWMLCCSCSEGCFCCCFFFVTEEILTQHSLCCVQ